MLKKNIKKPIKYFLYFFVMLCAVLSSCGIKKDNIDSIKIGIAWCNDKEDNTFYNFLKIALKEVGVNPISLDQVKHNDIVYDENKVSKEFLSMEESLSINAGTVVKKKEYDKTNVKDVVKDIDLVIFAGGEDISTSLYENVVKWHGIEKEKDHSAERDVSDYLLMSYCLDEDIPVFGICRGEQLMGIVNGCTMIQDIETYFKQKNIEYDYTHRKNVEYTDAYSGFAYHNVIVDKDSIFYQMIKKDKLENVFSWHHQVIETVDDSKVKVIATTNILGIDMIEGIEVKNKKFAVGIQFHPEALISKCIDDEKSKQIYDYNSAINIFKFLLNDKIFINKK